LLLVSDGSHHLMVWNASTFAEISRVAVLAHFPNSPTPQPVSLLNELEYDPFTRTILANVWYQDFLVRIDRETGRVLTVYDLSSLYPASERDPSSDVLNGIAAVPDRPHEVWVTGKQWPFMYRIRLIDPDR
jgi:glutamine cyclotransferase